MIINNNHQQSLSATMLGTSISDPSLASKLVIEISKFQKKTATLGFLYFAITGHGFDTETSGDTNGVGLKKLLQLMILSSSLVMEISKFQ